MNSRKPNKTIKRTFVFLIFITICLSLSTLFNCFGQQSLADRYALSIYPSDIVMLIDASTSTNTPITGKKGDESIYSFIRDYVLDFSSNLNTLERLNLSLFASNIGSSYTLENSEGKKGEDIKTEIEDMYPKEPLDGKGTDIKTAIHHGLTILTNSNRKIRALFILTDGKDQPVYPEQSPSISKLRELFNNLPNKEELMVYGFPVRNYSISSSAFDEVSNELFTLLNAVFPAHQVFMLGGSAQSVIRQLESTREKIREQALKNAVNDDLLKGNVEIKLGRITEPKPSGEFEIEVYIKNNYDKLPVKCANIRLLPAAAKESLIEWQTNESSELVGTIDGGGEGYFSAKGKLNPTKKELKIAWKKLTVDSPTKIDANFEFVDEEALEQIGFNGPAPNVIKYESALKASYYDGYPLWKVIISVASLALTVIGSIFLRKKIRNDYLFGRIFIDGKPYDFSDERAPKPSVILNDNNGYLSIDGQGVPVARFKTKDSGNLEYMVFEPAKFDAFEDYDGAPIVTEIMINPDRLGTIVKTKQGGHSIQFDEGFTPRKLVVIRPSLLIIGIASLALSLYFLLQRSSGISLNI